MCGIFGLALKKGAAISSNHYHSLINNLYRLSESRGRESSGFHVYLPEKNKSWTLKASQTASRFLKSKAYKNLAKTYLNFLYASNKKSISNACIVLAHSRLVTNGSAETQINNQPVEWGQTKLIHNGIIVNVDELWKNHPNLKRHADVDTEIIAAMLDTFLAQGMDEKVAINNVFSQIQGAASIAFVNEKTDYLTLATNTGDLYYILLPHSEGVIFASESYILKNAVTFLHQPHTIQWLRPGQGLRIDTSHKSSPFVFALKRENHEKHTPGPTILVNPYDGSLLHYNEKAVRSLTRCSRCVLPETFPFIHFDKLGVCNYCKSYKPYYTNMDKTHSKAAFIASLEKYRQTHGNADVIVPFSGGRDSSYGLHLICKEFGLNPITFTYDWGMVTDLARRNIARMCGQMGVQNILVSANIPTKRKNIRNNVAAWLKKPDIGMVPLFMAGDKSFFKLVNQVKKQTGISLNLWCANPLENTDFKTGFCGIRPDFDKERLDYLSLARKFKLSMYYANRFIKNPGYINTSLFDTFAAFLAYYFEPRLDFYFMFNHFIWNENDVNNVLLSEYGWEMSPDSSSTWRIGDGTAPFYNYIYNTAHGFSEFDTFRSNQIREGMISRQEALDSVCIENRPREESLRWYLDTIGLDFNHTIKTINQLDTAGLHQ